MVFTASSYGHFSSWHWNPGLEGLVWGWNPLLLMGSSATEMSLPIFIWHTCMWDQPVPHFYPTYQSWCGFFFKSLVVGLAFSWISGCTEWWVSCSLVVILVSNLCYFLKCHNFAYDLVNKFMTQSMVSFLVQSTRDPLGASQKSGK